MNEKPGQYPGGRYPRGSTQETSTGSVSPEELRQIIEKGDAVKLNEVAYKLGEYYATGGDRDRLSYSQIRGIFDHLQRMYQFDASELQLLRPRLAYAAGRHGGKLKELRLVTDNAIQLVGNDEQKFMNFRNFFEAIVAYHRYHGGK